MGKFNLIITSASKRFRNEDICTSFGIASFVLKDVYVKFSGSLVRMVCVQ